MDVNQVVKLDNIAVKTELSTVDTSVSSNTSGTTENSGKETVDPKIFQEGKSFQGFISDVRNNQVTIALENGSTITAKLMEQLTLNIGETISFEIKSNDGQQIIIKPSDVSMLSSQSLETFSKALEAANIPVNEKNLEIIKNMMDQQLPISKANVQEMVKNSIVFKDFNILSITQLKKWDIPITKENLNQLENYKNFNHQILKDLTSLMDEVPMLLGKEATSNSQSAEKMLQDAKLPLDSTLTNTTVANSAVGNSNIMEEESNLTVMEKAIKMVIKEMVPEDLPDNGNINTKNPVLNSETMDENAPTVKDEIPITKEQTVPTDKLNLLNKEVITLFLDGFESEKTSPLETTKLNQIFTPEELTNLTENLKNLGISSEMAEKISSGALTEKELLNLLKEGLEQGKDFSDLFSGKEYQKLIRNILNESWTMIPEELKLEKGMENFYKRLESQVKELENLFKNLGNESATLTKNAGNIQSNLDFMNQINQMYQYVQIPLRFQEKNIHSDLYVYTNKKNIQEKKDELTALIHLEMDTLGSMDIQISLKDKVVDTKFHIEEASAFDFLTSRFDILEKRLEEKGYQCKISGETKSEEFHFVEDFLEKNQSSGMMQRYSFDMRA